MDGAQHPWIGGNLTVPRGALSALEAEARAAYARDEEACGYLTGPSGAPLLADEAVVMPNLANRYHALDPEAYPRTGRMYFLMDARKFQRAIDEGEGAGRPVKVLWHSHLDVGAYFSETDAAAATMGGDAPAHDLAYLVTSVRGGEVDDHKLFVWDTAAKAFVETRLTVAGEGEAGDR
jgi:[CysO sulfur-carrier protein]-S-L-cysteine hydrolase